MSARFHLSLEFGDRRRNLIFELDDDTLRDVLIHWRPREAAVIEAEAGYGFRALDLAERFQRRREFIKYLGGCLAERVGMLLEQFENDKAG